LDCVDWPDTDSTLGPRMLPQHARAHGGKVRVWDRVANAVDLQWLPQCRDIGRILVGILRGASRD